MSQVVGKFWCEDPDQHWRVAVGRRTGGGGRRYGTPEGTFSFRYLSEKKLNKEIKTEIKTKNISFYRVIISF